MASYNEILDTLKDDLNTKLTTINGYNNSPKIRHGVYSHSELEGNLPAVCFECYSENLGEMMGDNIAAEIFIKIYGFTKNISKRNTDDIRSLAHDVVYFLYSSDNTYKNSTFIESVIEYWEGGISKPISSFVFDIKIRNDVEYSTLRD